MAYRTAEQLRWSQMDFVVGYEVKLTQNGKHVPDICDELVGKYPKSFKFSGWHPHCLCYTIPILKTEEEFLSLDDTKPSVNAVTDTPANFKQWVWDNKERIEAASERGKLPYFLRDNFGTVHKILNSEKKLKPFEIAQQRHANRTQEQKESILKKWHERQERIAIERKKTHLALITSKYGNSIISIMGDIPGIDTSALRDAITKGNVNLIQKEAKKLRLLGKQFKADAHSTLKSAATYGEVSGVALDAAIKDGNIKTIWQETKALQKQIADTLAKEVALESLIPNSHDLHLMHSMSALETAYMELDGVMNKWLSKYNYTSLDNAPLEHLKNKLSFELTSPTIRYSQNEIIQKALKEKIRIINKKIEWINLIAKANALKEFKTKSSIFNNLILKIDDAINHNDFAALQKNLAEAELKQQKLLAKQAKQGEDIKSALNKEYKGGVIGSDLTSEFDVSSMISEDPFRGNRYTNNAARMQGFDAPAKLVSPEEFKSLAQACGDVFFRTVNPTTFNGKDMTASEFAAQLYTADLLELNGPGGRAYGDGMYVTTSAWDGSELSGLNTINKEYAKRESLRYGFKGKCKLSEMTWTRNPKIILESDLDDMWDKLTEVQKEAFGGHRNTYACALGYDAMYCNGPNYMVIWNRSIIAVKNK